ncbi:hypothetical protein GH714_028602 [Hevea brasiliensis]|uniref:NPK1-activating kinesin-like protein C-terminal domain-containing protein n=1 Tax=Hevea brasiliensis TaxID=3981 RepID=A0A6A6LW02_HEVBR|nr:hypothetical protein GH714_028602 [Hevea brasiliensis]
MLVQEIRKLEQLQRQLGEEANQALEVLHKEVAFHRLGSQATTETIMKMLSEIKDMQVVNSLPEEIAIGDKANLKDEITRLNSRESAIASLERKLDNVQKAIDMLVSSFPSKEENPENKFQLKKKNGFPFALSNSSNVQNIIRPSKATSLKSNKSGSCTSSREGTPNLPSNSVNVKKMQRMFKNAAEENVLSIRTYVTKLKERVAKLKCQKQLPVHQEQIELVMSSWIHHKPNLIIYISYLDPVLELEANEAATVEADADQSPMPWHLLFEDQRKQIVMLWHLCHVSLREHNFICYLKETLLIRYIWKLNLDSCRGWSSISRSLAMRSRHCWVMNLRAWCHQVLLSIEYSIKALKQEREYLAKRVSSKLTAEEREMLYAKWEIPSVGKQTRLQPVNKLRTDPLNMQHMQESAEIIAKLVRFCESGERISKEMFELNFVSPCDKKKWMGWNLISNLLAF